MNLTTAAAARLKDQVRFLDEAGGRLVVDADTHITDPAHLPRETAVRVESEDDYFHGRPLSVEQLLAYLDLAGVDAALCWQNPACTEYTDDPDHNYAALLAANRYILDAATRYPRRVFPAGWTDPRALGVDGAVALARELVTEFGFPIVKMNPAQNRFPIDSDEVMTVVEQLRVLGAGVAFHFGADTEFTPAHGLARVADTFPDVSFIGVHMGGGGASYLGAEELYRASRLLGLTHTNISFVFSAKRDTHIESDLITYRTAGRAASERLMCASDAPYGLPTWNYGGFRTMFESLRRSDRHPDRRVRDGLARFDDDAIAGFMGGNFSRLYARLGRQVLTFSPPG